MSPMRVFLVAVGMLLVVGCAERPQASQLTSAIAIVGK